MNEVIRLSASRILRERLTRLHSSLAELEVMLKPSTSLRVRVRRLLWPELEAVHDRLLRGLHEQLGAMEALASATDLQSLRQQERMNAAIDAIESSARRQGRQIGDVERELFLLCRRAAAHEDLLDRLADCGSDFPGKAREFVSHADQTEQSDSFEKRTDRRP